MTKVLQVINLMYPYRGGMTQVVEDIMQSFFGRYDVEQKIICFNDNHTDGEISTHRNETVHDTFKGVEVIRCGSVAKLASQLISLTFKRELSKLMKDFAPDVVILHYPNPFAAHFLLPFLKKNRRIKFIVFWHLDIVRQKFLRLFFHRQNLELLERADTVIATSQNYIHASKYLSRFEEKCTVIPCCVNTERILITPEIQSMAENIKKEYSGKTISFSAGRLVPYKGFKYLIEASEYLDDDFAVFIAGVGVLNDELHELAKNKPRVKLLGRISDEELNAYYLAADMIAFPSITKNEAFGIALAEGMYFGKPAVTFTIPGSGVNYVNLDGVTGIECPNMDVKAFAQAMMTLKNDRKLRNRLGENARKRVTQNFMYSSFREKITRLIDSLR
ncbi:MAG: glycosyltransferase [Synergistaceae bacterium]|nr:glycosyltransferase [Synergistaceae bacterium]